MLLLARSPAGAQAPVPSLFDYVRQRRPNICANRLSALEQDTYPPADIDDGDAEGYLHTMVLAAALVRPGTGRLPSPRTDRGRCFSETLGRATSLQRLPPGPPFSKPHFSSAPRLLRPSPYRLLGPSPCGRLGRSPRLIRPSPSRLCIFSGASPERRARSRRAGATRERCKSSRGVPSPSQGGLPGREVAASWITFSLPSSRPVGALTSSVVLPARRSRCLGASQLAVH